MTAWFLIALAIVANITTNLSLKKLASTASARVAANESLLPLIASPWFWVCGLAGMTLLASYALAIRSLDLSLAYALVTSGALVGITLAAMLFLEEPVTPLRLAGVALVIAGLFLISRPGG